MTAPPTVPPTGLPVEGCIAELRAALGDDGPGHAVLHAPPGAGKTTVVPLRLLGEPWLAGDRIVVLEPRRVATRAAARRMAELLGEEVGETVGYRTRDEQKVGRRTRIEVITDGILTRRLQHDPSLPGIGLVVFDEVHERNLQTDLALALTLDARAILRPSLRLLAMSATLDTGRMARVLGGDGPAAPVVASEGRAHPVEIRWRPTDPGTRPTDAVASTVLEALRTESGDVLAFLAGAGDIRRVAERLAPSVPADVDVRPLFGALPLAEQDLALAPSPAGRRRVVLATDLAETSLTVAGVRVVVDGGEVRSPAHDPRSGLTRLRTGPTSRASAEQRAGRAGRLGPGVAYRLWSEGEHGRRPAFTAPEITAVDLAGLTLELAVWGTPAADLPFLDPPPAAALADAHRLLHELGALDAGGRATEDGRAMASLPVHPRLARMIRSATTDGHRRVAGVMAALLEERDVLRGRPEELPTGITDRVRLVVERGPRHPSADGRAIQVVRRRAEELWRRAGTGRGAVTGPDIDACGKLLALAYPDRIAQARGAGRFRLRNGTGAVLPTGDELVGEAFLVVAGVDDRGAEARIRLAAGLDEADVVTAAGSSVTHRSELRWDTALDDLRQRDERRLGALVLSSHDGPAEPGPATTAALVDRVRATRLATLRWRDADRALQARLVWARATLGPEWPDVGDDALLASVDLWLAPRLVAARGRADLERIDMGRAVRDLAGHAAVREVADLLPDHVVLAGGRSVRVDYDGEQPTIAVRAQDLFGTTVHPTVAGGRVPLVVQVLSPAGRPVQVTADLPGFWAGSWRDVRKEMAGRYPRHDWPIDPATARPRGSTPGGTRRR